MRLGRPIRQMKMVNRMRKMIKTATRIKIWKLYLMAKCKVLGGCGKKRHKPYHTHAPGLSKLLIKGYCIKEAKDT